jgi:hypothetical protein
MDRVFGKFEEKNDGPVVLSSITFQIGFLNSSK